MNLGMNGESSGWRRLAVRLMHHAAGMMPGAGSPWGEAMRRELDYIEDDQAAVRWALGCLLASYRAKLARRPLSSAASAWRQIAACGVLMLLIGLTLPAGGQTEPPEPSASSRPAADETTCGPPGEPRELGPHGMVSVRRNGDAVRLRSDCADPHPDQTPGTMPDSARGR